MWEYSAGAVMFTEDRGVRKYLLVYEKTGHYGFAKGHLEAGETEKDACIREIREETGLEAEFVEGFCRVQQYPINDNVDNKQVTVFLCRFDGVPEDTGEVAFIRCEPYETALELITYEDSKEILRDAEAFLNERSNDMEEMNIITLTDENGSEVEFELLDMVEHEGQEYVVLLPTQDEEADEVVILRVDPINEEEASYVTVGDEETMLAVFEIFKENHADEFDFAD